MTPTTTPTVRDGLPATVEDLERALSLKQLQINRLLNITQAINANVDAGALFEMYASFLSWEIGIGRMALYFRRDGRWGCAADIGLSAEERAADVSGHFGKYTGLAALRDEAHPLLASFNVVIPVLHKDEPLAYVFLGDVDDSPEMYNKVQFVTTITNVIAVAIENKRLFKKQLRQERYQTELALASDIQRSLVPDELPRTRDYDMAALYVPRFGVGGDFYSAETFADGKLLFCVADIAGKGTGAALLMSNFEASFWTLARVRTDMRSFVRELNRALFRVTRGDRFVTLFVGEYDPATRVLTYVNAGHNAPLLVCGGGGGGAGDDAASRVEELASGCTFLGAFEELPPVETGTVDLARGGLLLTYTDGVTELARPGGEMYGEERLGAFAAAHCAGGAGAFNDELLAELHGFRGEAEATDDLTVLTIRFAAAGAAAGAPAAATGA